MDLLLFAETSSLPGGHTVIAERLEQAPILRCDVLRSVSGLAIAEYFETVKQPTEVQERVYRTAHVIVDATASALEFVDAEEDPELDPKPVKSLELSTTKWADRQVDESLQAILENIEGVSHFQRGILTTYLFRMATSETEITLISEIKRYDLDNPDAGLLNPRKIVYSLGFSGYQQNEPPRPFS
jgi:hypothetical protein